MRRSAADDMRSVLREAEQLTYRRKLMIEKSFRSSVINASFYACSEERRDGRARRSACGVL
ncbi:MAG: hypothetical protein R2912_11505 [Eubacteriales bacterium]